MKIEPVTCILMFVCALKFWLKEMAKNCSFREIPMIKMVILDQNKPIRLILKNKK